MCGYTRLDRIRNEAIRDKVEVAPIEDKTRKTRLRRFAHVKRSENVAMRRCEMITILECRRGRLKKSLKETIKKDLNFLRLTEDMPQDMKIED